MNKTVHLRTEIPGPRSQQIMARVEAETPRCVGHATPLAVASASGATFTDVDGNVFLDWSGGIGTMNSGHCPPSVVAAVSSQAARYMHVCFMVLAYEPYVELCARLNRLTPGTFAKKTVLFNSGAEAVENAVKFCRAYTGKPGVVVLERAFHGRTMMALAMTSQVQPYKVGFEPFPGPVYRVSSASGLRLLPEDVGCVVVEPVQGEGGFHVVDWLPELASWCSAREVLLVADEIQSGFGRTGKMFACEHFGVEPDLVCMAKSLSGGLPISALTGRAAVMDALAIGSIGGTYGGNPVACASALASLEVIEGLLDRAVVIGDRVRSLVSSWGFPVRGLGAMVGIELPTFAGPVVSACLQRGLLILKAGAEGNVIRTLMPLVITDEQLEEGFEILGSCLNA